MAPLFFQVYVPFWENARREGWTDDEKQLGLYLLTGPHRNLEGLFRLPYGYVVEDLGWDEARVEATLSLLVARGFAAYDDTVRVVLIVKGLRFQCPKGQKQITGALTSLRAVPATYLMRGLIATAEKHCPDFAASLKKAYPAIPDTPSKPYPRTADTSSGVGALRARAREEQEQDVSPSSAIAADEDSRPDIIRLCKVLADLIVANDPKATPNPAQKRWRTECRLLIDRDGRTVEEVERVMRWALADSFWRSNVLSMPKLREKFGQLKLRMEGNAQAAVGSGGWTAADMIALGKEGAA